MYKHYKYILVLYQYNYHGYLLKNTLAEAAGNSGREIAVSIKELHFPGIFGERERVLSPIQFANPCTVTRVK